MSVPALPEILFEDNHLIAVNKRPGDIVQGDKTGDVPLSEVIKDYLKEKYHKPGAVFTGVIHRIDRPVSGVVVFARTSKALARMNELFRSRETSKTYWAVVSPPPPHASGTLIHYLIKNERLNLSKAYTDPVSGADRCELSYRIIGQSDTYTLLEVKPITGRHHQIRVQLSAIGSPIKGDVKYGARRGNHNGSIHLHARKLSFVHPVSKQEIAITASPPDDPVWNVFRNLPAS